jgi:GNAT superfamily N-acetyltransferase
MLSGDLVGSSPASGIQVGYRDTVLVILYHALCPKQSERDLPWTAQWCKGAMSFSGGDVTVPANGIRQAVESARNMWRKLWGEHCGIYCMQLSHRVIDATWSRIASGKGPVFRLVAQGQAGKLPGFCNYVCHPNTWSHQTVCYLEDLYVSPAIRRMGLATRFISALTDIGRRENSYRLYRVTKADNEAARRTYDRRATGTGYVRYEINF